MSALQRLEFPLLQTIRVIFGLPPTRRCARQIASKSMCAKPAWWTIGRRAVGPICVIPSAPTISPASDGMSGDIERAEEKPPHLDRLSLLWRRVAERKIVQWGVAYVALAYGIQHGVVLTGEAFDWPHAIEQITMLL